MSAGRNDFKKWFGRDNLVIVILAGILLFVIALPTKEGSSKKDNLANEGGEQSTLWAEAEDVAESRQVTGQSQNQEYVAELEEKLSGILSRMSGVGKAEVMITLSASEELVVEKDTPVSRSSTNENDSAGGSRIISQMDGEEATVYRTNGNESEPYVVKTLYPKVEGVVVVAEGAGNGTVNKNIVDMVQVLFDLDAHKVKVVKMVFSNAMDQ